MIDHALRSEVVISALDIRGLDTFIDISKTSSAVQKYTPQAAIEEDGTLSEFARATGGSFFQNNNDLSMVYVLNWHPRA